ncbi:MAG: PEGA domain-containing protein, partial [Candidatus Levybacteria bacterium]|nr:PEGA domain-containing protein [Candidatus Levybacteria bacterium]
SKVYINGKLIGQTPLCKCEGQDMLAVGEYNIKVDPENPLFTPFEEKITISKSILTVVDRTFGKGVTSEGSIISLTPIEDQKAVQLLLISFPENAQIAVDSSSSGVTPLLLKDITESDHEVTIKKDGYREKTIRIKTIAGYKLTVVAYLGVSVGEAFVSPTPSVTDVAATPSAAISVSNVVILETPTGFLRVRDASSSAGAEMGRVNPGETFAIIEENQEWYKITLEDGKSGWVSKQYAQKQ